MTEPEEISEDRLLGGRILLRQPRKGHRAGTDAVLVAQLAGAREGDRIVDLGSASGAIGLILAATVPATRVALLEREGALVELARDNIALNGLGARVAAIRLDAFAPAAVWREAWIEAGFGLGEADLVVTNPPYFDAGTRRASPEPGRRGAHVMAGGDLPEWIDAASRLLRPRGRLALIHRADALAACLAALARGFGSVVVRAVHPKAGADASRIVLTARKGGRAPFSIAPPLILHGPDGDFTPEAAALHHPPR